MGRAKCRKCNDIIISKHRHDCVTCSCGAISVDGGNDYFKVRFDHPENFICIDDEGNEIIPKKKEVGEPTPDELTRQKAQEQWENEKNYTVHDLTLPPMSTKPTKHEMLTMLDEMIERIENLPQEARYAPITHADHVSLMLLVVALFRAPN